MNNNKNEIKSASAFFNESINKINESKKKKEEEKESDSTDAYDSTRDTMEHILTVRHYISSFCSEMLNRGLNHDKSKLESPEKEAFDKYTPILDKLVYGSEEYEQSLKNLDKALQHHYKKNTHHPQHYKNGIDGMDLFDLIEMYCDWLAATKRTDDGDISKSIDLNKKRFDISEQLYSIFKNTVKNTKNDERFK